MKSNINHPYNSSIIGEAFGHNKVIYSVAQDMDAVEVDNRLTYKNMGIICFGDKEPNSNTSDKVKAVKCFFEEKAVPHLVDSNMQKRQWENLCLMWV